MPNAASPSVAMCWSSRSCSSSSRWSRGALLALLLFLCGLMRVAEAAPAPAQPLHTDLYLRFRRNAAPNRQTRSDEYVQPFIRFRKSAPLPYDIAFQYVPYMTRI